MKPAKFAGFHRLLTGQANAEKNPDKRVRVPVQGLGFRVPVRGLGFR